MRHCGNGSRQHGAVNDVEERGGVGQAATVGGGHEGRGDGVGQADGSSEPVLGHDVVVGGGNSAQRGYVWDGVVE